MNMPMGSLVATRSQNDLARSQLGVWLPTIVAFCLLSAFYFSTGVTNRSESVDSVRFAADAEVAPFWLNHDARMLLFYWVNRALVRGSIELGLDLSVYTVLGFVGAMFASGSIILLYNLLKSVFRMSAISSAAGAATLGFSYGFMRYANEVEVYIGAIFLTLVCLYWLFHLLAKPKMTVPHAILIGSLGGVAVAYYQPVALALFFATIVLFFARGYVFQYLAYGAAGVLTYMSILGVALRAELGHWPTVAEFGRLLLSRSEEFSPPGFGPGIFVKAAMAVLHDVFSMTSLYALSTLHQFFKKHVVMYYHVDDLFYAAENYPVGGLAIATFCLALGWFCYLCISVVRLRRPLSVDSNIMFVFAWLFWAGLVNIVLNPGEKEVWILALVPLVILVTVFVYSELDDAPMRLGIMVGLLLGHNLIGGMLIFRNHAGDRYGIQSAWLRSNASPGDWIVSTSDMNDWYNQRIIRYPFDREGKVNAISPIFNFMLFDGAESAVLKWPAEPDVRVEPRSIFHVLKESGGRVFVFESVIEPSLPTSDWAAQRYNSLVAFSRALKPYATIVADGPGGKTYQIDMEQLPASFAPR